jgi:DNA repair protein RecN (Recombination protein N)
MIVELSINNFAIIDNVKINFEKGFNVLTGETGAGKSIIIEGISMILGQRANRNLIRSGEERAIIEGVFYLEDPVEINETLEEHGIDIDPNNYLIITREIYNNGRTISRVNGRVVTLSVLNDITANLVDIHGQHEHQSLLDPRTHIKLVDSFGNEELKSLLETINKKYRVLQEEKNRLKELSQNIENIEREIDLLQYQLKDIDSADIFNLDEDEIMSEYNKLNNIKDIAFNLGQVIDMLNSDDYSGYSIINGISKCRLNLNNIEKYDEALKEYNNILESVEYELKDLYISIKDYLENLELDEEGLIILEEKIDLLNSLKRKYGNTIEDIIEYRNSIEAKLNNLLNNERAIEETNKRIESLEKELMNDCLKLTDLRKRISKKLEANITKELEELNMKNVVFKINFDKHDYFTAEGLDKIEFLISTNKGEELKPLSKIVSGGEMARIMLAFKKILSQYDNIPTLIFDEIDTGISGRTAQIVGEKIKSISKNHQVICISHLPQIAALADVHFLISKEVIDDKTFVAVKKLDYNERIEELSRLLGGVNLTNTTKLHAKEMLDMSRSLN